MSGHAGLTLERVGVDYESNLRHWRCPCGTTSAESGAFRACDGLGRDLASDITWCGLYRCSRCGRVFTRDRWVIGRVEVVCEKPLSLADFLFWYSLCRLRLQDVQLRPASIARRLGRKLLTLRRRFLARDVLSPPCVSSNEEDTDEAHHEGNRDEGSEDRPR